MTRSWDIVLKTEVRYQLLFRLHFCTQLKNVQTYNRIEHKVLKKEITQIINVCSIFIQPNCTNTDVGQSMLYS